MRFAVWLSALVAACLLAWAPGRAVADSSKHGHKKEKYKYEEKYERKKGKYKYEYDDGNCKYKYKSGPRGYKEEVKCRHGARSAGGPPPWAPAHGYRAKHKRKDRHAEAYPYVPPFDLGLGRCNREVLGSVLGGAAGAAIGAQIGRGDGQTAAIIGGAILGVLVGGSVGRMMDEVDQHCIGQALEHAPDGQAIVWKDPNAGAQYQVVPTQTFQRPDGRYCREYTTTATVGGRTQQVYGTACRQPDGSWQLNG
ncbi:MAG: RT0821/Lpp0805 family surface protein [Kiloniellaceae bacterium]